MVTDEDARRLVADLRRIAGENEVQATRRKHWREHCESRADAYRLAAGWLEQIIHEEADDVSDSSA